MVRVICSKRGWNRFGGGQQKSMDIGLSVQLLSEDDHADESTITVEGGRLAMAAPSVLEMFHLVLTLKSSSCLRTIEIHQPTILIGAGKVSTGVTS